MENSTTLYDKRMSHFVGIGLVLGFLLPHTSTALMLVNPLLCIFYMCFKANRIFYKRNWFALIPVLLSLFINYPQGVEMKALLSCITILLYFFCFPFVGRVKIPSGYFYLILIVIILTQLAYVLKIPFLTNFLDVYYPFAEGDTAYIYMRSHINLDNMLNYRLGGLYRNSNQCSRFITFLLAGYLVFNESKFIKMLPFVIISLIGVVLTGSRTGFFVAGLLVIVYTFVNRKVPEGLRYLIVFLLVGYFIFMLFSESSGLRGTTIENGIEGSLSKKWETFLFYLSTEHSVPAILLGHLDTTQFVSSFDVMSRFDSEYGILIFSYGFIGFICILVYFYSIFKRTNRIGKVYFILLLWAVSSTIVSSFRAFFVFMLLLSVIYTKFSLEHNSDMSPNNGRYRTK